MFELETLTKAKVLDVRVLIKKDRKPDEDPGAQLLLQATLGAGALAMFDGFLPSMLYRKATGAKPQGELDGLETAELTTIGEHTKRLPWVYEQTGCEVTIDFGMGGRRSNIALTDCKVHRVSMRPEAKGVVIQWTVDAPGLNDQTRGRLTGLKSTEISMTLSGPEVDDGQADIEGESAAERSKRELDASGKSPFPKGGSKAKYDAALVGAGGGSGVAQH